MITQIVDDNKDGITILRKSQLQKIYFNIHDNIEKYFSGIKQGFYRIFDWKDLL